MRILIFIAFATCLIQAANGQGISPEKFNDCRLPRFCLDCGDPKAAYPNIATYFRKNLPPEKIKKIKGFALVQLLVDSTGHPCVSSQTGTLDPPILAKLDLRGLINSMGRWTPALVKGKPVHASSTLRFDFHEGQLAVSYLRLGMLKSNNMSSVGRVEISNTHQEYSAHPQTTKLEVFNQQNSAIPWDMMRVVLHDQSNTVWVGTDGGLVKISDGQLTQQTIAKVGGGKGASKQMEFLYGVVDAQNNKWLSTGYDTYRYDGTTWTKFDSTSSPLNWLTAMYADKQGNVWFGANGLVKYDGKTWTKFTSKNSKLPAASISGIYSDQKQRLWVGTYKGNIRLDGEKTEEFNGGATPLAHSSITSADEDADGTIWFGLYARNNKKQNSGLAKYTSDGRWEFFTAENSGFPGNDVTDLVVDKLHHVVWASVSNVGLCRFDGKTWTLFTPKNSAVPSTTITDIAFDAKGALWCATHAGLVKLTFEP